MKRKILDIIGFLAFMYMIGSVGALECNTIGLWQCFVQSAIGLTVSVCAFLSN